jgi:transcriptional regulator with XRE-family HTH domain
VESIKRRRKALGLSLMDVATRAGLHDEAVARIERAGYDPRISSVLRVARAMGVPICELVDDPEQRNHGPRHPHRSSRPHRRPAR